MSPREFQIEFERRLQIVDPTFIAEAKLNSNMVLSLLNEAIDEFYKTRYSGTNPKGYGFEQTEKRIDDLRTLIKSKTYTNVEIVEDNNTFTVTLPADYTLLLGDTVGIIPSGTSTTWSKDVNNNYIVKYGDTLESSIETIDRQKENSLTEYHLHYNSAKPLKVIENNKIILHTDGKYKVSVYTIKYLSKPSLISLSVSPTVEYTDLPVHTHTEIVKLAVQKYLGMKGASNYNSYSNEVNKME